MSVLALHGGTPAVTAPLPPAWPWLSPPARAPNAFYVPSPVVLLTTEDSDGQVDVSAMSAVGVVCLDPPVIAVGIKARRRTYRNIRRTGTFVVNLPLEDDLHAVDYTGTRKFRHAPDKVAESGLSVDRMPETKLPYVTSCPVAMACELVGNLGRHELGLDGAPSHQVVLGRITECTVERRWLAEDELRLEDMPILLYLNRMYAAAVAISACSASPTTRGDGGEAARVPQSEHRAEGTRGDIATQHHLIERILTHLDRRTTDAGGEERYVPVTDYLDPQLYAAEVAAAHRCRPLVVGHAGQLAEPGDFLTDEVAGTPVLVVRDAAGGVRCHVNVCRHRGFRLVGDGAGTGLREIICGYHAWTYDPTGDLRHIPDQKRCFPGVDRSARGLLPMSA